MNPLWIERVILFPIDGKRKKWGKSLNNLFHLDRSGSLKEGQILTIDTFPINSDLIGAKEHAKFLFEDGVSMHGYQYLNQAGTPEVYSEWFFEYVRRSSFSNRPSRFQSFFAFSSLKDLQTFKEKKNIQYGDVYSVECNNYFRADMNLVGIQNSPLLLSWLAHTYWSGETSEELNNKFGFEPLWEYLVAGPVKVLKKIK